MNGNRHSEPGELRGITDVAGWIAAGLCLSRVPTEDDSLIAAAILACANERGTMPPPGMVSDVAALLAGQRLPVLAPIDGDRDLRIALCAYDDDVLARLVTTTRFDDVLAAFAHLSSVERPLAIALVVGAICDRSSFTGTSVSQAALRRTLARPRAERDAEGRQGLLAGTTTPQLADAYLRLARNARQSRALVDDRVVFALDHLTVLRDLGSRVTADHIQEAAEAVTQRLPRRLPSKFDQRGIEDTHMQDDDLYPAGGFTSIAPAGLSARGSRSRHASRAPAGATRTPVATRSSDAS